MRMRNCDIRFLHYDETKMKHPAGTREFFYGMKRATTKRWLEEGEIFLWPLTLTRCALRLREANVVSDDIFLYRAILKCSFVICALFQMFKVDFLCDDVTFSRWVAREVPLPLHGIIIVSSRANDRKKFSISHFDIRRFVRQSEKHNNKTAERNINFHFYKVTGCRKVSQAVWHFVVSSHFSALKRALVFKLQRVTKGKIARDKNL